MKSHMKSLHSDQSSIPAMGFMRSFQTSDALPSHFLMFSPLVDDGTRTLSSTIYPGSHPCQQAG